MIHGCDSVAPRLPRNGHFSFFFAVFVPRSDNHTLIRAIPRTSLQPVHASFFFLFLRPSSSCSCSYGHCWPIHLLLPLHTTFFFFVFLFLRCFFFLSLFVFMIVPCRSSSSSTFRTAVILFLCLQQKKWYFSKKNPIRIINPYGSYGLLIHMTFFCFFLSNNFFLFFFFQIYFFGNFLFVNYYLNCFVV